MFQRMMYGSQRTKRQAAGDLVLRREGRAPLARAMWAPLLRPLLRASIALLAFVSLPALCAGINDTGISFCSDDHNNGVACGVVAVDHGSNPRQNGRYGRDAQAHAGKLTKIGNGSEGFDYTKICNSGQDAGQGSCPAAPVLGSGAADWACTHDNVTGLTWEVKTTSGLRNQNYTYAWFSSDTTNNGGFNIDPTNLGSCDTAGRCDTEKFVADVNDVKLCGARDWRMPTLKELEGLSDFGLINPAIDLNYFPNTRISPFITQFWSGTPNSAQGPSTSQYYAWIVDTANGSANYRLRAHPASVRLVRGGS